MAVSRPLWLQALTDYTAEEFRAYTEALWPNNVVVRGLQVGPTGTVSMNVTVTSGFAVVQAKSATGGKYLIPSRATQTRAITAAAAQPRIDLVVMQVLDSQYGDVADSGDIVVIAGVPAASPAVPATPNGAIALAQVNVRAATASILGSDITDVRVLNVPVGSERRTLTGQLANGAVSRAWSSIVQPPSLLGNWSVTGNTQINVLKNGIFYIGTVTTLTDATLSPSGARVLLNGTQWAGGGWMSTGGGVIVISQLFSAYCLAGDAMLAQVYNAASAAVNLSTNVIVSYQPA